MCLCGNPKDKVISTTIGSLNINGTLVCKLDKKGFFNYEKKQIVASAINYDFMFPEQL